MLQRIWDLYFTLLAMMTLMTVIHAPLTSDGALSGLKAVYSSVFVKSFNEILLSVALENTDNCWDTENYALSATIFLHDLQPFAPQRSRKKTAPEASPNITCIT